MTVGAFCVEPLSRVAFRTGRPDVSGVGLPPLTGSSPPGTFRHYNPAKRPVRLLPALALLLALPAAPAAAQNTNCDTELTSQAEVDAFDCTTIEDMLIIEGSDISNLDGLAELEAVVGELYISFNPELTSLEGLGALTYTNFLTIRGNGSLTTLGGLDSMVWAQQVVIDGNASLTTLAGFAPSAELVSLIVVANYGLTSLAGLSPDLSVEDLALSENNGMTSLAGIGALADVPFLTLVDNASLSSLGALQELQSIGFLDVRRNDALEDLSGLGPPLDIERLRIMDQDALTDLHGLDSLRTLESLSIRDNDALTSIRGLEALTSTGLRIIGNRALTDLDPLERLAAVGGDLVIQDNPNLVRCAVGLGPILAAEQADPSAIGGLVAFGGNDPEGDCNAADDVLAAYLATDADAAPDAGAAPLAAYPNPAAVPATLAFALAQPAAATLVVYDALGREVARPYDGPASGEVTARLPALLAGLYVARLTTDGGRAEAVRLTVLR